MGVTSSTPALRVVAALAAALLFAAGCNRAMARIPLGTSFPRTLSGYSAEHSSGAALSVAPPFDARIQHYGEKVAGTGWTACKTDALDAKEAGPLIGDRLVQELRYARLFSEVSTDSASDLQLQTEIHAFCAQAFGFVWIRVAGITAIRFKLVRADQVLYDRKIERVVTDGDPEYTGKQVSTIEAAMLRVMADSLREVMKALVSDLDREQSRWTAEGARS